MPNICHLTERETRKAMLALMTPERRARYLAAIREGESRRVARKEAEAKK